LQNVAEFPGADVLVGGLPGGVGHRLHADRDRPAVLHRGIDYHDGFADGLGHRLFHVDVLALLHGVDRHASVPVVGRGDAHHVYVLVVQNGAIVLRDAALAGIHRDAAGLGAGIQSAAGAVLLVVGPLAESFIAVPHVAHRERFDRLALV